jgi:hypothetical protein
MQWFNNFMSDSLFYLLVAMVGWSYILKALKKNAPNVTSAAKDAAAKKALSMISKFLK